MIDKMWYNLKEAYYLFSSTKEGRVMRKEIKTLIIVACLVFALSLGVKADAAGIGQENVAATAQGTISWKITGIYNSSKSIYLSGGDYYNQPTFGVFNYKNQLVASETGTYVSIDGLKLGQAYTVRCRVGSGPWSDPQGFIFLNIKGRTRYLRSSRKTFTIRIPKNIKGVKKYTIKYASKKATGSNGKYYKKSVKTVKARKKAQNITLTKIKGKRPRTGRDFYYIGVFPKFSNGVKCSNFFYFFF